MMCRPMWNACRYSHSRQVCWLRWSCSSAVWISSRSDQYGDEQFAAALSEPPGELPFTAAIRARGRGSAPASARHRARPRCGLPACPSAARATLRPKRRRARASEPGTRDSGSSPPQAPDFRRRQSVRGRGGRRASTTPMISRSRSRFSLDAMYSTRWRTSGRTSRSAPDSCLAVSDLPLDEPMRAIHHAARQILLGPVERR